jgi:adenine-specific DNA-methyltransferase
MWVGKENAKREYKRKINKTLRPDIDASRDWSSTGNLYIEGDNLDALKLLQKSYSGRIKMIYIDPPYNTGNDFVYCDEYAEDCGEYLSKKERCDESGNRLYSNKRDGGHFHSNWCSMMYPRLCIARTLLSPDGVIFISIDDNEIANLKKICDEIFGENNAFPIFNRVTKKSSDSGNNFAPCMDYVLGYAKNISCVKEFKVELTDEIKQRYTKEDEYVQSRGPYQEVGLFQAALKHGGSSYYIECPDG